MRKVEEGGEVTAKAELKRALTKVVFTDSILIPVACTTNHQPLRVDLPTKRRHENTIRKNAHAEVVAANTLA